MKWKNLISLVPLTLLALDLSGCGVGDNVQKMPSGVWQMTFYNGLMATDCTESGLYPVVVEAASYDTDAYFSNGSPVSPQNQLFYGVFESQIGISNENCFTGTIGGRPTLSYINFCNSPQILQGYTIRFYGCYLSNINYSYQFNASYEITGNGVFITGSVSGINGSVHL